MNRNSQPVALTAADIRYLLGRLGITQRDLARKYGKHEMTISRVIKAADGARDCISTDLMKKISSDIGVPHTVAFGRYFNRPQQRRGRKPSAAIN